MKADLPSYIHITDDVSSKLQSIIKSLNPDKVGLMVDENTRQHCLNKISLPSDLIIEIKSGEIHKNLTTCSAIWNELTINAFTRKSVLINLGGGVIGDMGGFAASTYKRGITFINVPTTLLSQVDASIGGKLGIDFEGLKNHIGVFNNPQAVIVDPVFLETLPKRELLSGYAEVIKHALIWDATQWESLCTSDFDSFLWKDIIEKSIRIKGSVVTSDPYEKGVRKILNFGHTLGHAIESYLLEGENRLLHGEAIAIGMILESHLSMQLNMLTLEEYEKIKSYIRSCYSLPKELPAYEKLFAIMQQDKKNSNKEINFSLIEKIGKCSYDINVTPSQIMSSMAAYIK